jgi:hypothetical protein
VDVLVGAQNRIAVLRQAVRKRNGIGGVAQQVAATKNPTQSVVFLVAGTEPPQSPVFFRCRNSGAGKKCARIIERVMQLRYSVPRFITV